MKLATFGWLPVIDGRWSDFIVRIASSGRKDRDGTIELYADGAPVAFAQGEFGLAKPQNVKSSQYFKIGPYRNNDAAWGSAVAAVEVRDIRRGPRKEDVTLPRGGADVPVA